MLLQFGQKTTTKYSPNQKVGLHYTDADYEKLYIRETGLLSDEPISSKLVNTVLRQSTFAYTILQNVIINIVGNHEPSWTVDRIRKALSCCPQTTEDGYGYSDLINVFISYLNSIRRVSWREQEDPSTIIEIKKAVEASTMATEGTIKDKLGYTGIDTWPTSIYNTHHKVLEETEAELTTQFSNLLTSSYNDLCINSTTVAKSVHNYDTTQGTIRNAFNDIEGRIIALENR